MRDPANWSLQVANWKGVSIRVHAFLLVFIVATLALSWQVSNDGWRLFIPTLGGLAILVASVLLHEFGHLLVARRAGLLPSSVLIGPFGGLHSYPSTLNARVGLRVALAGPLANLAICFAFLCLALVADRNSRATDLLNWMVSGSALAQALKLVLWINGLLALINLLPAFPFDGGRIMRAALAVGRPNMPRERNITLTFWCAVMLSGLLAVVAAVLSNTSPSLPFPLWIAPAFLACVTIIGATHEFITTRDEAIITSVVSPVNRERGGQPLRAEQEQHMVLHDEPPFLFEPSDDDSADTWADSRAVEAPMEESTDDDDQMLDKILTKLHAHGRDSLTEHECAFLQRVSARYRHRQRS